MTIPGRGDLAPLHRHSPIGRYLTGVVVIALLAGGGFAAYQGLSGGGSSNSATKLPVCKKHSTAPQPPQIPQSKVTVNNASLITGLATQVAGELRHRGFKIGTIGNALAVGKGVATIRYSSDRVLEANKLAAQIKGAKLTQVAGSHTVELDINPKFTSLASKQAAGSAFKVALASQHLVSASPTPTATPTCTSRG